MVEKICTIAGGLVLTAGAAALTVVLCALAALLVLEATQSWHIYTGDSPCLIYRT
jgi:hypothetical protein